MNETLKNKKVVSGIYMIWNNVSKKFYIGSSINVHYRWTKHKRLLVIGKHPNIKLQNAFNKYGIDTFEFFVLELVDDKDNLLIREQYWIDFIPPIFNIIRDVRKSSLGTKTKEEVLKRLSIIRKGKKHTEEFKEKAKERMIGNQYAAGKTHIVTDETRVKISNKLKGTRHSKESYVKSAKKLRGRVLSDSHKIKIIEAHRKNKPEISTIKQPFNGKGVQKLSEDTVLKIRSLYSNGVSGLVLSKEFKVANSSIYKIVNRKSWKHI